jgi:hypothetical protein
MIDTKQFDIEALPVAIAYAGETERDNNWKCDEWRVTFENKAGKWTTRYFTGLGLREKLKGAKAMRAPGNWFDSKTRQWYADRPKKPLIAAVLYSLFMDARAAESNFNDWCDEYGFSSDSIKALNMYKECLETAAMLRRYFSPDVRAQIETIIQDM